MPDKRQHLKEQFLQGNLLPYPNIPWHQLIQQREKSQSLRRLLKEVLLEQHQNLPHNTIAQQQIALLENPKTFTITTGQQPILFGGPLFVWYKALQAIGLSQMLKKLFPDYHFIPIFWIASEDHDADEIRTVWIDYTTAIRYPNVFENAPVGFHRLTKAIIALTPSFLKAFWQPGKLWSQAFAETLAYYLGSQGLLLLDASHPKLKQAFKNIMQQVLDPYYCQQVYEESKRLKAKGLPIQVRTRLIPLFYIDNDQGRVPIYFEEGYYYINGQRYSKERIQHLLSCEPDRFSPNVVLRTVYQEFLLPNIAYIGGWAEVAYWLQLRSFFQALNIPYPAIIPRQQYLLFPTSLAQQWQQLGLPLNAIQEPLSNLCKIFATIKVPDIENRLEVYQKMFQHLEQFYDGFKLDNFFKESLKGHWRSILRVLKRLEKKSYKAICRKYVWEWQQIKKILYQVQPPGAIQERTWSLLSLEKYHIPLSNFFDTIRRFALEDALYREHIVAL